MGFTRSINFVGLLAVIFTIASSTALADTPTPPPPAEQGGNLGVIKGMVRDDGGSPIADATVAIFRSGTSKVLKQVRSATDGSFIARILPGTYTIFAVAQGYNPVTLSDVEI